MVDVTDGADIEVGLGALELLLGHRLLRVSRTVVLKGVVVVCRVAGLAGQAFAVMVSAMFLGTSS
jgi:hypothetical protein